MTAAQTAVVIGGGIAGPVTAMALQLAGIQATVHEAYASAADGVGGMLGLAPNGLDALAAIDLDGPVRRVAEPVSAMVVQSWTGKQLATFDDPSGKPIMHLVWRADLYRALYDEAKRRKIMIEHSHRFVEADESRDAIAARFSDGSTASADVLIGADGIRSTVRSMIDLTAPPPDYTGLIGLGGWSRGAALASTNSNYNMIFGKKAFFGYQVPEDGQVGWFANLPHRERLTLAQARAVSPEQWLRLLADAFAAEDAGCEYHCPHLTGRPDDHRRTGDHANRPRVESGSYRTRRGRGSCAVIELRPGRLHGDRGCRRTRSLPA